MTVDTVLSNAKAYFNGNVVDCNVAIDEGIIQKIGKEAHMPRSDEKTDMGHLLLIPGVIDSHVHLRDEGKAYKETFLTGTAAAATGGVTTVLDMPNNEPVTMSAETLRNRMQIADRRALVNVGFYSEFPESLDELKEIAAEGVIGFKLFLGEQIGGVNIDDDEALLEAITEAGQNGVTVATHAEDHMLLKSRTENFKSNNRHDIAAFLKAHDESVEVAAVERLLQMMTKTKGTHLHICHVSSQKTVEALSKAKELGANLTCEVTPHHLLLSKETYDNIGASPLTLPPLRTQSDNYALWEGIKHAQIDTIGSDHAPHSLEEKDAASIWEIKAGIPGLETILSLVLTSVHNDKLTLARALEMLCERPAEIFGIQDRGRLEQGMSADIVAVDFNLKFKIDASNFKSKAKFSPFDGWQVQGKPLKTYVNGKIVMDEGKIVATPGSGGILRRKQA